MTRPVARTLGILLVVAMLSASLAVGLQGPAPPRDSEPVAEGDRVDPPGVERPPGGAGDADGERARQMDEDDNGSAPPGGFVSSVVGMEEASVDATVAISRFEARYSSAPTDEGRAAAVATTLDATRTRVTTLERRLRTLEARRANGSISEGWFAVELSWLLSSAEGQREVLARLERAARKVPRERLASRNASVERIERLQERVDRLLETDSPGIHRTTFDRGFYRDLAVSVETFDESAASTDLGVFDDLLDDERVNLYVQSDEGPSSVVSFRTTGDSRITDFRAGEHPDATVRVRMDERTARRIANAEDPGRALWTAFVRGEIAIEGIGWVNGLKWGVRNVVLAVFRVLVGAGGWIASVL